MTKTLSSVATGSLADHFPVERCRELLTDHGAGKSDSEVLELRDKLALMSEMLVNRLIGRMKSEAADGALIPVPPGFDCLGDQSSRMIN